MIASFLAMFGVPWFGRSAAAPVTSGISAAIEYVSQVGELYVDGSGDTYIV